MSAQTKGLAALLAAQGRNGDDELIHVNKRELAALERLGRRHGIETTINPNTGLREAFNWGSTIGGVLGGIGGTFAAPFTGGVINPYTGAMLGSAAGTKLSGGSNEEALMNGAIAGVTAWGLGGAGDALGQLGQEAGKETIKAGVQTGTEELAKAGTQELAKTGAEELAKTGIQEGTGQGIQQLVQQAPQNSAILQKLTEQGGEKLVGEGMSPQAGSIVGDKFVQTPLVEAPKMSVAGDSGVLPFGERASDYFSNVSKGIQSLDTPGKIGEFAMQNKGNLLAGGLGAYALATGAADQPEDTGATDQTSSVGYRGEVYYTPYGERRTRAVPMAGGGLSSLGSYSDGGQLLRGPGDGVSDSIPATIADRQPARLAEGEFVVPARAVSELGNGSTEAGSKQLYAMLDRIAKKRKKGKGLAYNANPKNLLPA